MRPFRHWEGTALADAFAAGPTCGIGGFLKFPTGAIVWVSERFSLSQLTALDIPVNPDLQKHIGFFECLAQLALLHLVTKTASHCRFRLCIPAGSDNTMAESRSNCLFSTKQPLALVLEKIAFFSSKHSLRLDISHIPGERNDKADFLSRWTEDQPIPLIFTSAARIRLPLPRLWYNHPVVSVYPLRSTVTWLHQDGSLFDCLT